MAVAGLDDFCWQDNAPAYRASGTEQLLPRETSDFIAPTLWPVNSPYLSPVDYWIWGKLQKHVYCNRIHDIAQLKLYLIKEWEHFNQTIHSPSIKQSGSYLHDFKLASELVKDILNTDLKYA